MTKKSQSNNQDDDVKNLLSMTSDTVGRDLLQALVQEIKLLPDLWVKLSKKKQDDVIDRLRDRVETNVKMVVHLIASNGAIKVVADLEGVAIKDDIKATFKVHKAQDMESLQHLFESVGQPCMLVVADVDAHTGGMKDIQGEADQRAMDLGKEYNAKGDGDGMDGAFKGGEVVDVQAIEHKPLEAELDKAFEDGYEAASEDKDQSACPTMTGALCIEWIKGWKSYQEENNTDWWQENGSDDELGGEAA